MNIHSSRQPAPAWIWAGGAIAGALDILFAIVFWAIKARIPAERILQSVASGLLGPSSFQGGAATAALGLALHFFIACAMAWTYYAAARIIPVLRQKAWLFGPAYGLVLYLVMNYVVVPMSAARPGSKDQLWVQLSILVHMFLIGLPIALCTRRARRP